MRGFDQASTNRIICGITKDLHLNSLHAVEASGTLDMTQLRSLCSPRLRSD